MKAAYINRHGGPDALEVGEVPDPVAGPGEVVVQVKACALNHLDLWVRRGLPGVEVPLPHIGGSDVAGVVAEVGDGVDGWEAGDRVAVNPSLSCGECEHCERGEHSLCRRFRILGEHVGGGLAERVRVPARNLFRLPDTVDPVRIAATPLAFQTAWRGLMTRGRLREGDRVLITGASGGVSTAAIQIAKLAGATVFAVTSGPANVERVRELGADRAIDRLAEDFLEIVRAETGKRGVDIVLDSVGEAMWDGCVRSLTRGGRLVVYGATTGSRVGLDLVHVFWKQLEVVGTTMANEEEFETVMTLVADGSLEPVIDDIMPLERIRDAHERLEAGEVFGKLVLVP